MLILKTIGEWLQENIVDNIGALIGNILNTVWMLLCQIVYPLISAIMAIFTEIAKLNYAGATDNPIGIEASAIINRITLILTIVMTFYITFEFVKYTVSPDTISDKQKGAIPLFGRIIIAILLLAFVPKIFTLANKVQFTVINNNVIGKVILGVDENRDISGLGREFAGDLFSTFIIIDEDCINSVSENCIKAKTRKEKLVNNIKTSNVLYQGAFYHQWDDDIQINGLLALIFGCFVLYVIFLYCKDIALRHIQLLFLQIISPIAIMSYISPKKDGMFQKWTKQCLTTYLDVFIRMAVLYFMMLLCNILTRSLDIHELTTSDDQHINIFVYLFLIGGLMMFLKKVPKLLQELFPSSGAASIGFGFSAKDRQGILKDAFGAVTGVAARGAGAVAGIARTGKAMKDGTLMSSADNNKKGKIGRMRKFATYANTMGRAAAAGFKAGKDGNIGNAIRAGQEKAQAYEGIVARGGTVLGHDFRPGYYQNEQASIQVKLDLIKGMKEAKSNVNSAIGEIKFRKQMDSIASTIQASGNAAAKTDWDGRIKAYEKLTRKYADGKISQTDYTESIKNIIKGFNEDEHGNPRFTDSAGNVIKVNQPDPIRDLELDSTSKYTTIQRNISEAKEVAQALETKGISYDKVEINPSTGMYETKYVYEQDKYGNIKRDAAGNPIIKRDPLTGEQMAEQVHITYDDSTFAENLGDYADWADAAKVSIESSKRTKMSKTNSEGKK